MRTGHNGSCLVGKSSVESTIRGAMGGFSGTFPRLFCRSTFRHVARLNRRNGELWGRLVASRNGVGVIGTNLFGAGHIG